MFRNWFEQLRAANQRQLETIRNHNELPSGLRSGFVRGKLTIFLLSILILCIADGLLTIQLLNLGAWEANPFMRYAIARGLGFFIFSKYFLTAGGMLLFLRYGKVRILREMITLEEIAAGFLLFYQGLVIYEIECYLILT